MTVWQTPGGLAATDDRSFVEAELALEDLELWRRDGEALRVECTHDTLEARLLLANGTAVIARRDDLVGGLSVDRP